MSEARGVDVLPAVVRQPILDWAKRLEEALGDDLVGVLVHGSVARGEYRPNESDVNAIVVLKDTGIDKLDAMGDAMLEARYAARVEPTILREDEIEGATDVFPLLYAEAMAFRVLVAGRDPFVGLPIHDTHRRLRIEQELRSAQISLRRAVTDALGAREAIGGAVARKLRQVRRPLRALLALKGIACAPDHASVLRSAAELYGVDAGPFGEPRAAPDAAHDAFVRLLDGAIRDVNALG
jgi:predicted nucleotidyltransferase